MKASVKLENFVAGRWTLGRVCHTLQVTDFCGGGGIVMDVMGRNDVAVVTDV